MPCEWDEKHTGYCEECGSCDQCFEEYEEIIGKRINSLTQVIQKFNTSKELIKREIKETKKLQTDAELNGSDGFGYISYIAGLEKALEFLGDKND